MNDNDKNYARYARLCMVQTLHNRGMIDRSEGEKILSGPLEKGGEPVNDSYLIDKPVDYLGMLAEDKRR